MFDGGHTLGGAFEAVRGASAEDTILEEALGSRCPRWWLWAALRD